MTVLAGIGFTAPWLLLGLLALPILWLLLRAVPPAPIRRLFPAVTLLLGIRDDETVSDRTPWWLLLLRMLAVAAVIIGLAGPVLNPSRDEAGSGPLLVVMDATWAGASHWSDQTELLSVQLAEAGRAGRQVAILHLSDPEPVVFQSAAAWRSRLPGLQPEPWQPSETQSNRIAEVLGTVDGGFDTLWISDGLDYAGRDAALELLAARGDVTVYQSIQPTFGLRPAKFEDGVVRLTALRTQVDDPREVSILAQGRDPAGTMRILARATAQFAPGDDQATADLSLPSELRARITRFEIEGQRSAGSVTLADDSLRRHEVAIFAGRQSREGLALLSGRHYLTQVVVPTAEFIDGTLLEVLPANPDVVILADIATLSDLEEAELTAWVEKGGLLLRFAGPRLAASDLARAEENTLMPVRLRGGGRSVGGAMSWGEAKTLAPFEETSPFFGLRVPAEVTVTTQVMAQPDPTLADRVIASLNDGTPLVTRKTLGLGQVVLFHVTANAEWSNLPLSGLFVEMLDRLAVSSAAKIREAVNLEGTTWTPTRIMDGFGALTDAGNLPGMPGEQLALSTIGPDLRPGIYTNEKRSLAMNVITEDTQLSPATWPASVPVRGLAVEPARDLSGILLSLALMMLVIDVIASLMLSGRLGFRRTIAPILALLMLPTDLPAQTVEETDFALASTNELVLAHVLTGDTGLDRVANAGLRGLSDTLFFRTSIEPANPVGINLEVDELAFFPLLYWPITPDQPLPSDEAYAKLNTYLRSGGMILFDTRDADIAGFGASSPNGRKLQQLAAPLDIPPLEPVPSDHVLTRTFYLLQDFPGRYKNTPVWVEAAPPDAEQIEGMPFRNLNDGVTPVVIGGNDWAGAWATDPDGRTLLPVGRGYAGERQRELAYRFGVNLVMHVLTGNYKSDQVHVPALLDRLGQ
ncbi:DUF4159 domain-containing protein [Tropicibacter sp. R16_0]|uniref:DUF4159 domain-containing protein n=1 Tax=Tropicibacter sp. R16_0 TaxID=2821102 RepID=UPI001ADD03C0|nr:DUF4159 domain-containing protein [Tropicibacter sp. R16_0]MBO9450450.1 DUF4159 domain-containing protein [Tropicibacter sp. R16_0]